MDFVELAAFMFDLDIVVVVVGLEVGELVFFSFRTLGFLSLVGDVVDFSFVVGFFTEVVDSVVDVDAAVAEAGLELETAAVAFDVGLGLKEVVRGLYEPALLGVAIGLDFVDVVVFTFTDAALALDAVGVVVEVALEVEILGLCVEVVLLISVLLALGEVT